MATERWLMLGVGGGGDRQALHEVIRRHSLAVTEAVNGGEPRNVLGDWQYEPGGYDWSPNGEILVNAAIGGRTALFRVSPRNGRMTEIIGGRRRINDFSYDQRFTKVAYVSTSVDRPTELFIADANGRSWTPPP